MFPANTSILKKTFFCALLVIPCALFPAPNIPVPVRADTPHFFQSIEKKNILYKENRGSPLSFDHIEKTDNGWNHPPGDILNFSFSDSTFWLTFPVEKKIESSCPLILRLPYPLIDSIHLYYRDRGKKLHTMATGDHRPFMERPLENRNFIFPLNLEKGITRIYLKIRSTSSLRLPLELISLERFIAVDGHELALLWIFYGLMIMLCLHNIYLFLTVKEKMYGIFSLFIVSWILYEAAHNGIGFQYLWPGSVFIQDKILPLSIALCLLLIALFFITYLQARDRFPFFSKALTILFIIPGSIMIPLSLVLSYSLSIKILLLLGLIASPLLFIMTLRAIYKKSRQAKFLLAGTLFMLAGQMMSNLLSWGILPYNTLTSSGVQAGSVVMILVFSMGLSDRLNSIKKNLEESQLSLQFKNQELTSANEQLQAAMEELEATNEEFEAQNEELIASQMDIEQNEAKLRIILDRLPIPVIVESNDIITLTNQAFIDTLGYQTMTGMTPKAVQKLFFPDDAYRHVLEEEYWQKLENAVDGDIVDLGQQSVTTASGGSLIMEIRITIAAPLILVIFHDITEQQKSREIMIQTEKMMTLGGLAAGMAHEINNPLGIISQGVQTTLKRLDAEGKKNRETAACLGLDLSLLEKYLEERNIYEYLKGISEAGSRAAATVSSMLDFSRKESTQWEKEDINRIIDETINIASKDYNLEKGYDFRKTVIKKEYQKTLPPVHCLKSEIQQVVLNLLRNASQAMASAKTIDEAEIIIVTSEAPEGVNITIKDKGPGIDPKKISNIFDPFFTTKEKGEGTGLGLSVSRFIINERHNGSLSAENLRGGGVAFTIFLPLNREKNKTLS